MKSSDILTALAAKYPSEAYALFSEVNEGTGAGTGRRADAIAIGLWPSRGLDWLGFEIKVTLNDLVRELADPSKAEAIARHLDRWYLVTPVGLTAGKILPSSWGLLEVDRNGHCHLKKEAEKLSTEAPESAKRSFLASVARHAQRIYTPRVAEEMAKKAEADGRTLGYANGFAAAKKELSLNAPKSEGLAEEHTEMAKKLKASGLTPSALTRLLQEAAAYRALRSDLSRIQRALTSVNSAVSEIEGMMTELDMYSQPIGNKTSY
jgi:hypothetical protein